MEKKFSEDGISFNYPVNWQNQSYGPETTSNDTVILGSIGPLSMEYYLTISKIKGNNSEKELKKIIVNNLKSEKVHYNAKLVSENQTVNNGLTTYNLVYTKTDESVSNERIKILDCYIGKTGNFYNLKFTSYSIKSYEKNYSLFQEIISTVKVE